ncbi:MAG TPA: AAA family ATPase, partial [Acidimicrobiales bacterium]|nr:AAA family ATPase [Acidimicrobiales bacterium]
MSRRVTSARFIGRTAELATVDDLLVRVATGEPATLLVAGDAGVGKTRLIEELARRARDRGFLVLAGGCLELCEGGIPMAPIVEALRRWRDQLDERELDEVGLAASELRFLIPDPPMAALSEPGPVTARPSPGRVLELVLGLVLRLADRRPTVLVTEDLHWADRSTLDLLSFLDRNLAGPVLLVGTFRSDELHRRHPLRPFLGELERSGSTVRLDLAPFDRAELTAQAEAITGATLRTDVLDELLRRSEGNPFFVEELLATEADRVDALPDSLRDILLGRVADLPDDQRAVLRLASTL